MVNHILSVRSSPGPLEGPAGGLPRAQDETGRQNVIRSRLPFIHLGQLEKITGRDNKMPSVLVLEFPGRPSFGRTTSPTIREIFL